MAKNGDRPQKVSELAEALGVEPLLLGEFLSNPHLISVHKQVPGSMPWICRLRHPAGRLMRHLGAMGYVTETAMDEYKPTNYSKAMSIPIIGDGYLAM